MENNVQQGNPLKQFFRSYKLFLRLPSGANTYSPADVMLTEAGEIGVMPMTGRDELILKNPDALLNGEALIEVITSCVPGVKNPKALLTNDIDALITAIRYATFNDSLESSITCPNCQHENNYKLDLQYSLDNMSYLESEYSVYLENGLVVFVKPYTFPDMLKALHAQFEQTKIARSIENDKLTDSDRSAIFKKAFSEIATSKFDLMCNGIVRIVNEKEGIDVSNKTYVKEFLQNIDKKSVDKIGDLIDEINKIGIKKTFTAVCEKCNHSWENDIDFNPVNFS